MAQFKKPSKKATIITAAIIIVLLIIAATGTVMFLRDRGQTEASEIGQEQVATQNENAGSQTQTEEQPVEGEQTQQQEQTATGEVVAQGEEGTEVAQSTDTEGTTRSANAEVQETTSTGTTTSTTQNGTTGNTGTTTTTEDIQESTITRTETVETPERKVAEDHNVWWTPMSINADIVSTMDNIEKDDITVEKTATTKTGSNLVQPGEEIIYTITVTNNSGKELNGIEVKDSIPDNTTYVSAENLDHEVYGEDGTTVEGLVWNLSFAEGEKEKSVTFTVRVNDDITGTISNVAMANGEESESVKTAVIKAEKTSVINGDEKITTAKVGDTITYTILVTNTGDIDGTTTVKDKDLEGILSDGKAEMYGEVTVYKNDEVVSSDKTANDLINGIKNIEVPANGSAKVEFTIKVNKVTGKISNVALVGDETETPTTPDVVDTFAVTIRKEVKDIVRDGASISKDTPVKAGDIINYNIIINNIGSGAGEVSVSDILANTSEQLQLKDEQGNVVNKITLGVGQERTLTTSFEVSQDLFDAQEDIKNTVKATYDNGEDEEADVTTPVEEPNPGLQVAKTVTKVNGKEVTINPDGIPNVEVKENDKVTYTITVKNTGNVTLENIDVKDELKVEFGGKVVEPNTTLKTISSLAPDATDTIEVVYTVIKSDVENTETKSELLNVATASTTYDGEEVKDSGEEEVPVDEVPSLEVTKTATEITRANGEKVTIDDKTSEEDKKVSEGDKVTYTITVKNTGNVTLEDIDVTDELKVEVGGSLVEPNTTLKTISSLAPDATDTIEVVYTVIKSDVENTETKSALVNVATASTTYDGEEVKDSGEEEVPVDEVPSLQVTKTVTKVNGENVTINSDGVPNVEVKENDKVTYTITVKNTGNVTLENIDVTDELKVEFGGKVVEPNTTLKTISSLAPDATDTIEVVYTVIKSDVENTETKSELLNVATASTTYDGEEVKDSGEEEVPVDEVPSLQVTKTATEITRANGEKVTIDDKTSEENKKVSDGDKVTYRITVKNTGNVKLTDIIVTDSLQVEYEGTEKAPGATIKEISELAPNAEDTIYVTFEVTQDYIDKNGKIENVATATTTFEDEPVKDTDTDDTIPTNNTPNITLTKEATQIKAVESKDFENVEKDENGNVTTYVENVGDTIKYTITVTNNGGKTLENVNVVDENHNVKVLKITKGTNVYQETGKEDDIAKGTNLLDFLPDTENKTLEPGESYVIEIEYVVESVNNVDNITNTAKVTATPKNETTPVEAEDTESLPVPEKPAASIEKTSVKVNTTTLTTDEDRVNIKLHKGDEITYEIVVSNDGNKDLTDVVVTDDYEVTVESVEKVNADGTRTLDEELTANADNDNLLGKTILGAGEKYVITVTYIVPDNSIDESDKENGNKLTNIANLSAKYEDKTITDSDDDTLTKAEEPIISQVKASTVIRDGKEQKGSTIQKGDIIEYTITVSNTGNVSGTTTVKDTMLKDNIASGKILMENDTINVTVTRASDESTTSVAETTTVDGLANGLKMTIDNGDTVTITFRVKVEKLLPGETIANELVGANTVENKGKEVKVEINQETVKPQETVIVIDLSRSMAQGVDFVNDDSKGDPFADSYGETRWVALKDALDTFLGNYMDGNNKVTIIGYSAEAETLISGTSSKTDAMNSYATVLTEDQFDKGKAKRDEEGGEDTVDNLEGTGSKLESGTNVEAGLYLAEQTLSGKMNGANVILMTDGEANRYGHNGDVTKISSEDVSTGIGVKHAQDEAKRMKDAGATLYTITLSMGDVNSSNYNKLLAGLASEGKSASAESKDALKNIFEGISSIISGQHLVGTTEGGIVEFGEKIDVDGKNIDKVVVNIPNADGVGEIRLTWDEFDKYYDDSKRTVDINSMIKEKASGITSVTGDIEITITINNAN